MSMNPGATTWPDASSERRPERPVPTSTIRPSATATSARRPGAPVPSTTVPPRMTMSASTATSFDPAQTVRHDGGVAGQTLRWPDGDRIPEPIRTGLLGPGAPFEMATEEVLGSKMDVFGTRPRNLTRLLVSGAERFGDRPYLTFPDRSYTYRSIVPAVASVAAALRDNHGVGVGDRVAIAGANSAEWVVTFWAATVLGAITVAMNGWWTGPEMAYGLELTSPTVLLGDERRLDRLSGI